jgi:2-polyprenyl-6-methoxyphenol hydroxylase-like FAD-dependent oxidoreductase
MDGNDELRVAVVGGGIGGLAAALFLRRAGLRAVTVYEQAPALGEIGAGIQVAPNAVRLLRRLGLAEALAEVGVRLEGGWEFRRWEDGRVLFTQTLGDACERMFGEPYYVIHRGHLHDLLRRAVPEEGIRLGHRLVELADEGKEVALRFADGQRARVDALVGADGIRSVVHDHILPPAPAEFSGLSAYRCLVPADQAPDLARRPVTVLWLGPGRHFVHYPVSGGREINLVTANPAGDWREESWTADGRVEDLAAEFEGWDPCVQQLIAAATETKQFAFYDRRPLERWTVGRVALMGDAAHPMMPFFAQGASQAIEDGAVLAGCLREATRATVPQALARYESLRRERASKVQERSRARREHHHLPDGDEQRRRDAELAGEDPLGHNAWIYGHDVEEDLAHEARLAR